MLTSVYKLQLLPSPLKGLFLLTYRVVVECYPDDAIYRQLHVTYNICTLSFIEEAYVYPEQNMQQNGY